MRRQQQREFVIEARDVGGEGRPPRQAAAGRLDQSSRERRKTMPFAVVEKAPFTVT
jgi:hypothetical protein